LRAVVDCVAIQYFREKRDERRDERYKGIGFSKRMFVDITCFCEIMY
jgi:hypothetical protein